MCNTQKDDCLLIACDGPACAIGWYHAQCVGFATRNDVPVGEWVCFQCRFEDRVASLLERVEDESDATVDEDLDLSHRAEIDAARARGRRRRRCK